MFPSGFEYVSTSCVHFLKLGASWWVLSLQNRDCEEACVHVHSTPVCSQLPSMTKSSTMKEAQQRMDRTRTAARKCQNILITQIYSNVLAIPILQQFYWFDLDCKDTSVGFNKNNIWQFQPHSLHPAHHPLPSRQGNWKEKRETQARMEDKKGQVIWAHPVAHPSAFSHLLRFEEG